ncbi:MAG: hypothetical protein BroJett029_12160 [Alphaproteobacteria bacterium]|nr:MAG: hypothetical protein BroJett029_12160 [Alphaproteobacteria bacterium]
MDRPLSLYLDLLRVAAALWVFLAHAALLLPQTGLPEFWWTAEDAVMGFFVLSGFVVAHTAAARHGTLRDYAAARLARLWSVAVPALLLALAVDRVGSALHPLDPFWNEPHALGRVAAGLAFLHELWFASLQMPGNVPYWSIGYEFWYYVLFGCALYLNGRRRLVAVGAAALVAGPKILILLPVWAMGVAVQRIVMRGGRIGPFALTPGLGWALFGGSIAAYAVAHALELRPGLEWRAERLVPAGIELGWSTEFWWKLIVGALAAANLLGFAAIAAPAVADPLGARLAGWLEAAARPVRWLAGMSYSVYLFHWPLLLLLVLAAGGGAAGPAEPPPWPVWGSAAALAAVLAAIAGLAGFTERRKTAARRAVEAGLAWAAGAKAAMARRGRSAV